MGRVVARNLRYTYGQNLNQVFMKFKVVSWQQTSIKNQY